jgi:phenol 2-monooxygenase
MQFHVNGFRAGDPHIKEPAASLETQSKTDVDVLIVGAGPAGLTLAAQLSVFADINTRIIERKPGPLELGQADGLACRTLEMFEAFGFSERVIREAYNVIETVFWAPDYNNPERIARSGRIQDVEDDLSEFPHLILNQARVHDRYLEMMQQSARRLQPDYGVEFTGLDDTQSNNHVIVNVVNAQGKPQTIRARYVVGCDGARSKVRQAIGLELHGDSANQAWGVMDVLAVTDFPDIRFKAVVRSSQGNILVIPREGGFLVRLYIELDKLAPGERVASRNITQDTLVMAAQRIFHPYKFDVKEIVWWSVYDIGQRLCHGFDNRIAGGTANSTNSAAPTVFIAGDACHTHSPKAGQGMNVSMADAFNLGWKLAGVIQGLAPASLLHSYSAERHRVATDLIEFDRHWAARFSESTSKSSQNTAAMDASDFQQCFSEHGRYTAGLSVAYPPSPLVADNRYQSLATGQILGMRFHSAMVTRLADALPLHLGHTIKADGRWRLLVFANADHPASQQSAIWRLCNYLARNPDSPVQRCYKPSQDIDSVIDTRVVFQQSHHELNLNDMHPYLLPAKGRLQLPDVEKMFCAPVRGQQEIYEKRGISRDGCLVIVRPDQYVSDIMPIDETDRLVSFFCEVLS